MAPPRHPSNQWGMRKKLILYMLLLALLLLFALFSGIVILGRFESPRADTRQSLNIHMEAFEKDISTHFESLAAGTIELSRYISDYIEQDSHITGPAFSTLTNDPEKIEQIHGDLIGALAQRLQTQNCSGIFVMLDATVNTGVKHAENSRTGIYLQHNRYLNDDAVVLFRGNSAVSKANDIMPHRKWRLELNTDQIPNYPQIAAAASLPLEEAYMLTECTTLAGTSDEVVLMVIPVVGSDGTFYGICGYEISADYFMTLHAQPGSGERLACMLMTEESDGSFASAGLSCSGISNHISAPTGAITVLTGDDGLAEITGSSRFMGVCRSISLTPNNPEYTLAIMIPETDYRNSVAESWIQIVILILLLLFFAASCCLYFSKRYLSPIMRALDQIKKKQWAEAHPDISEINDLFVFLSQQDTEHISAMTSVQRELAEVTDTYQEAQKRYNDAQAELNRAQLELQRLAYSRKSEVDPERYQLFIEGLKTLTATEQQVLEYYMDGKGVKEIMELAGIKETTIRYHNRNIYSKLNVTSLKQLLLYAAVLNQTVEQGEDV